MNKIRKQKNISTISESTSTEDASVNVITLLRQEHAQIRDLFQKYEDTTEEHSHISEEIFELLELHTELEEQVLYPAFEMSIDDGNEQQIIQKNIQDHYVIHTLIAHVTSKKHLQVQSHGDQIFQDDMRYLIEFMKRHMDEEETILFSYMEEYMHEQLIRLGLQVIDHRNVSIKNI